MSRRYDSYYDDYPPPSPERRRRRDYDDVDVDVDIRRESDSRRAPPEYLRAEYGRTDAGPLVRRPKSEAGFVYERPAAPDRARSRGPSRREEDIDIDVREYDRPKSRRRETERDDIEIDIRRESSRPPAPAPPAPREEIAYRRVESDRRPRGRRDDEIDVDVDIREDDRPRRREQSRTRVDVDIREDDRPLRREASRTKVDIDIREDERRDPPPRPRSRAPPPRDDDELDVRFEHSDNPRTGHKDSLVIRERSRSRPPPQRVAREREEFYYRRRSPSPESPPRDTREEIIIRTRRQSPSPSPPREPSPPPREPSPEPITRPPIIQEVITHHRHIDHGVIRAPPSPESSPSPPPRPRSRRDDIDIDIRRKDSRGNTFGEDIRIREREDTREPPRREPSPERRLVRVRSETNVAPPPPPPPPQRRDRREETNINVNIDADFGALTSPRSGPPSAVARPRPRELWTEVTKDLVSKEALRVMGYEYEETDEHFYVMAFLDYDGVSELVQLTRDIKHGRRERVSQIEWEQKDPRLRERRTIPPPDNRNGWEERIHEREVVYEDPVPRRRRPG